jgi:hypothetical protein
VFRKKYEKFFAIANGLTVHGNKETNCHWHQPYIPMFCISIWHLGIICCLAGLLPMLFDYLDLLEINLISFSYKVSPTIRTKSQNLFHPARIVSLVIIKSLSTIDSGLHSCTSYHQVQTFRQKSCCRLWVVCFCSLLGNLVSLVISNMYVEDVVL